MEIFSNLAISVDGKIADAKYPRRALGTPFDRCMMQILRKRCDAIVIGTGTLRQLDGPMKIDSPKTKISQSQGTKNSRSNRSQTLRQPVNVILSQSGNVQACSHFWNDPTVIRVVIVPQSVRNQALQSSRDRAIVLVAGDKTLNLVVAMRHLKAMGLSRILVEGGGEIIGAFLDAGLLQEMNLTITPWILGGPEKNPSIVGHSFHKSFQFLRLKGMRRVGDELYLRYQVVARRKTGSHSLLKQREMKQKKKPRGTKRVFD